MPYIHKDNFRGSISNIFYFFFFLLDDKGWKHNGCCDRSTFKNHRHLFFINFVKWIINFLPDLKKKLSKLGQ